MKFYISIILFLCVILNGCGPVNEKRESRVGLDASWFPLDFKGRDRYVTGFSIELLKEIGKIEKLPLTKVSVNWDNLVEGLQKGAYESILSSIPPYIFNQNLFEFSDLYLSTGPVLVVPAQSPINSLKMTKGKEIAVLPETNGALLLEKFPGVIIRTYDSIPTALNAIVGGMLDGAIVDNLSAIAYCQDLYQGQLKIATPPLNEEGLRMLALKTTHLELIARFNRGLQALKRSGVYDKLLTKWELKNS